ncbi:MAG: hypothetical protein ACP5U2_00370 [Bryobacteraceae bacterium]
MAVSIKRILLWRAEVPNQPGVLAATLKPLAEAGASLRVVMGYRFPGDPARAAIELYPVTGKKATAAAQQAGLAPLEMPTLLVEGDDRPGLGHAIAEAMAGAGINLAFLVTQVIGRKYCSVMAFENEEDLKKASALIKKVKPGGRK